jgi:16S rRNA (cytosine967-C5)-methyltransferase
MRRTSSRAVALSALEEWRCGRKFADAVLGERLRSTELAGSDRAFATELFYGVLRNLSLLDFWISRLRSAPLDDDARDLLRLGLYQLFFLQTPEHAAVFETVARAPRKSRSLVNAVLRNAVRGKAKLQDQADNQPIEVRKSHPRFLIERWRKNFGPLDAEALCDWNNHPAPVYARVNRLKISEQNFVAEVTAERVSGTNFFRLANIPSDALASGHCYIQDPSTAAACLLLDPQPNERVLDACAAPGGKTSYIAELMRNEGFILACDRDAPRVKILRDNLKTLGVTIAQSVRHDWLRQTPVDEPAFDRILVDAPCSNTGVMRRRVDVRWRLSPDDFSRMATEQIRIVRAVTPLLKAGGVLVYSTCSLEPEENEKMVEAILGEFPFFKLVEQRTVLPFRDGFDGAYAGKLSRAS